MITIESPPTREMAAKVAEETVRAFRSHWSSTPVERAMVVAGYGVGFCVLLPVFLLATGFRLDAVIPVALPARNLQLVLGGVLVVASSAITLASALRLWTHGRGLPISHLPPTEFVASGLYRYFRHPIYVGFTGIMAGVGSLVSSFWTLAVSLPILITSWVAYALVYEEPVLTDRFGETYRQYRKQVGLFGPQRRRSRAAGTLVSMAYRVLNYFANRTVLFRGEHVILVTYGLLMATGTLVSMAYLAALLLSQSWAQQTVLTFLVAIGVCSLTFGKLLWFVGHRHELAVTGLAALRVVGFVSWGALTGMLVASFGFSIATGRPLLALTDMLFAAVPLCYAVGRLGCLTYGCCYGVERSAPGIIYHCREAKAVREQGRSGVPRFPTQTYSALHGLVLFLVLMAVIATAPPVGATTALAFILYGLGRFAEEFMRDRPRPVGGLFTAGHVGATVVFVAGWILLYVVDPAGATLRPLTEAALARAALMLPTLIGLAGLVFAVTSFHWKRIGTW